MPSKILQDIITEILDQLSNFEVHPSVSNINTHSGKPFGWGGVNIMDFFHCSQLMRRELKSSFRCSVVYSSLKTRFGRNHKPRRSKSARICQADKGEVLAKCPQKSSITFGYSSSFKTFLPTPRPLHRIVARNYLFQHPYSTF